MPHVSSHPSPFVLLIGSFLGFSALWGAATAGEPENSCFFPSNIGTIGTEPPCLDQLIVSDTMLAAASSRHVGGNESFEIVHFPSQVVYSFEQSERTIFTGQVTDFSELFRETDFNRDISHWYTRNVIDSGRMFESARFFNQDISGWEMGNVIWMDSMFQYADSFNHDISTWITENAIDVGWMFDGALSFQQNLEAWNVDRVVTYDHFGRQSMVVCPVPFQSDGRSGC